MMWIHNLFCILCKLVQLDGDIELKEEKVKSSINMKKALMQDLLTGKVRVDV